MWHCSHVQTGVRPQSSEGTDGGLELRSHTWSPELLTSPVLACASPVFLFCFFISFILFILFMYLFILLSCFCNCSKHLSPNMEVTFLTNFHVYSVISAKHTGTRLYGHTDPPLHSCKTHMNKNRLVSSARSCVFQALWNAHYFSMKDGPTFRNHSLEYELGELANPWISFGKVKRSLPVR